MYIDKSRHERQLLTINKWIVNDYKGLAKLVMRFGKTLIGALAIQKYVHTFKNDVIIIVPSEYIYNNWKNKFKEYAESRLINRDYIELKECRIFTAHEIISNNIKLDTGLIVIDELHKFTSDNRFKIINGTLVNYSKSLALTGTYPKDKKDEIKQLFPIFDEVDESEAIKKGWISNFIEYNLGLELSDNDKVRYERFSEPIRETLNLFKGLDKQFKLRNGRQVFNNAYDVIQSCYSGKYFDGKYIEPQKVREGIAKKQGWSKHLNVSNEYGEEREKYWHPSNIFDRVKAFNLLVRDRNNILINNDVKLKAVTEIFKNFNIPTICFSESTDFATKVGEQINIEFNKEKEEKHENVATIYHSKVRRYMIDSDNEDYVRYKTGKRKGEPKVFGATSCKRDAIDGMKSGRYRFISTARALDEGLDLPELSQVITTAGTTNPTQYSQRNARGKTVDIYNPEKVTRIINIYFKDFESLTIKSEAGEPVRVTSRDKVKLINRQSQSKTSVIWINNINTLS